MSGINIKNLGKSKLPVGNAVASRSSSAGVSRLPNDDQMRLEKEQRNELFKKSKDFTKKIIRFFYQSDLTTRGYRK